MKKEIPSKWFSVVCGALIESGAKTAIKYIDAKTVVKATWHNKPSGRHRGETVVVTFGTPNYREREFVRRCLKAGEPFPVRKVQLINYPKKKK